MRMHYRDCIPRSEIPVRLVVELEERLEAMLAVRESPAILVRLVPHVRVVPRWLAVSDAVLAIRLVLSQSLSRL